MFVGVSSILLMSTLVGLTPYRMAFSTMSVRKAFMTGVSLPNTSSEKNGK